MDRKLLDILCCPVTKRPLLPLSAKDLDKLNRLARDGRLRSLNDSAVEADLTEALMTDNGSRIYPVEDGIPVMLEERSITGTALNEADPKG